MELGLHIADFTWNGGGAATADTLGRVAREAEGAGVARLSVMDHVWQIGPIGPPELPMLEAYTTLGYLAGQTRTVRLHTVVTGVVYREPGLLAKQITTLDVLSGGRAGLGIGAAWNADESAGLGLPFPPTAERFERLEEAIQICLQMWGESEGAYEGKHYRLGRTLNSPQNLRKPYLMIGGAGERKTLRLVAQYADACNIIGSPESAHKLDVLRKHCDDLGRDYDTIEKTTMIAVTPDATPDSVIAALRELHDVGFSVCYVFCRNPEPLTTVDLLAKVHTEIDGW
jgi:F420-dependent oxidoreductase-like protein